MCVPFPISPSSSVTFTSKVNFFPSILDKIVSYLTNIPIGVAFKCFTFTSIPRIIMPFIFRVPDIEVSFPVIMKGFIDRILLASITFERNDNSIF